MNNVDTSTPVKRPRRLVRAVPSLLIAGVFATLGVLAASPQQVSAPISSESAVEQPTAVERMVARHGCWTGDAPAGMVGVIPGHVVVDVDGEARYGGSALVGKALEQLPTSIGGLGLDHGFTTVGFCR